MARAAAGAGGRAFEDCIDEGAAGFLVAHGIFGQIELEEAHAALDVNADGAGIDVRRRDEDAADGRAVTGVGVGVEDDVGNTGSAVGVERLLDAEVIEGGADCFGADDGDGGECASSTGMMPVASVVGMMQVLSAGWSEVWVEWLDMGGLSEKLAELPRGLGG